MNVTLQETCNVELTQSLFLELFDNLSTLDDSVWSAKEVVKGMPSTNRQLLGEMLETFISTEDFEKCYKIKTWIDNFDKAQMQ